MNRNNDLARVAERYRTDGYQVTQVNSGVPLPPFAAPFRLDLFATKEGLNVLVQVKENLADLAKDPTTSEMARVINAQPGWRFDLVVLNKDNGSDWMAREGAEPSAESLSRALDSVERAANTGDTAAAFLQGWAALEAAMRRAARTAELKLTSLSPVFLLNTLYANGLLELYEYDELSNHLQLRDAVVHGFEVPPIDSAVPLYLAGAARRLLAWDGQEQSV